MYQVWENDGTYIQGKLVEEFDDLRKAKASAKKIEDYSKLVKEINNPAYRNSDVKFWIEDEEGMPIGLIRESE